MRITLLEALPKITKQQIQQWDNGDERERTEILNNLIQSYTYPPLNEIRDAIDYNLKHYGIDPLKNPFLTTLDNMVSSKLTLKSDMNKQIKRLTDLYRKENINLTNKHLVNKSLYNREDQEFDYTVRLLDTITDKSKLTRFFRDTSDIKIEDLFINGKVGGELKPVAKDSPDGLFATVERWSGEDGENDTTDDYINSLRNNNRNTKTQVKINKSALSAIKDKYRYRTLDQIVKDDPSVKEEGNIIYAIATKHDSNNPNIDDYSSGAFYIYNGGKWNKFDNDLTKSVL